MPSPPKIASNPAAVIHRFPESISNSHRCPAPPANNNSGNGGFVETGGED